MKQQSASGQVVLITLLVLTIATTVALSLISRTTTDATISNQVEDSSRAFSAAEAGIEEALKTGLSTTTTQVLTPGTTYNVLVSTVGGAAGIYEFPKITQKGATETLWLVNHDPTSGVLDETRVYTAPSVGICWSNNAALLITLLYRESSDGSYRVAKAAFDPTGVRAANNNFDSSLNLDPPDCGETSGTSYKKTLTYSLLNSTSSIDPATDTLLALRIRPLYNDSKIAIDAGTYVLPKQGNRLESTGTTTAGTNRKIIVYQQYRAPSTIFDSALYSQGSISY